MPVICGLTPTEGQAEPAAAWDLVTCMRTHPITALTGAWSRVCAYIPHHGTYWGPVTCVCLHIPSRHLLGPGHVCVLTHPIMALTGAGHSASSEVMIIIIPLSALTAASVAVLTASISTGEEAGGLQGRHLPRASNWCRICTGLPALGEAT